MIKRDVNRFLEYSLLLDRWKNLRDKNLLRTKLEIIYNDFEIYKYFYKEAGASLKFNPLSERHSGVHVLERMHELLKEYMHLIVPKALFSIVDFLPDEHGLQLSIPGIHFSSRKLRLFTSHSSVKPEIEISPTDFQMNKLIVYVVTIGPALDDKVKELTSEDNMFEAYLLNGIGAGAAEMTANDLNLYVNDIYGNGSNFKRLSPGYGDWPVTDQSKIFKLLDPEKNIGVKLTDSYIMLPEKSTSGIMGIVD
jgi:hypothetical protein